MEFPEYSSNKPEVLQLGIDETAKNYLLETARWAKFLAIVGFIAVGILAIVGMLFSTVLSSVGNRSGSEFPTGLLFVFYLLIAILYFFPTYYLYRFSSSMKPAMIGTDQELLNESLLHLRKAFRFIGILTIVVLAFYALAFIIGIGTYAFIR